MIINDATTIITKNRNKQNIIAAKTLYTKVTGTDKK